MAAICGAAVVRFWCVVGARFSTMSGIVGAQQIVPFRDGRSESWIDPVCGNAVMEVLGTVELELSRTETQYLEGIFRGIAEWQQGGNMLPLCCLLVATLLPLLFVSPRREATKPATRFCFHGIHLPATAQLAPTQSVPVVATFLAGFDPGRI